MECQSKAAVEGSAGVAAMEALRGANADAAATRSERVNGFTEHGVQELRAAGVVGCA